MMYEGEKNKKIPETRKKAEAKNQEKTQITKLDTTKTITMLDRRSLFVFDNGWVGEIYPT